jgi:hypothetical protein
VICFLWYAESTRQVVEQKRAHGRFRQDTALQCSHSEDTTFLYCDFRFQALFYAFQKTDTLGLDDNLTAEICWNRGRSPAEKSKRRQPARASLRAKPSSNVTLGLRTERSVKSGTRTSADSRLKR